MKKTILLLISIFAITLSSCSYHTLSLSGGKPDESFVCFVASKQFSIIVEIDDDIVHECKTVKQKSNNYKNNKKKLKHTIIISPGKHSIKVLRDNKEIYSKEIFVSASEIKIITL